MPREEITFTLEAGNALLTFAYFYLNTFSEETMLDPRDSSGQQFYFIRPFVMISRGKSYRVAGAMYFEPPIYLHYCPTRESYGIYRVYPRGGRRRRRE